MDPWLDTYNELRGVRLNMIVGDSGQFIDKNGSSRGISNELDRRLISHLRKLSDVVVTGGNTARNEKYTVPTHCKLAVISSSFELDHERFIRLSAPDTAISILNELGLERILLETGPKLSKYFLETDQVDEFCLTVAGGDLAIAEMTVKSFNCKLELAAENLIDGTRFTRWRRGNR